MLRTFINIFAFLLLTAIAFIMLFPVVLTFTESVFESGFNSPLTARNFTDLLFTEFDLPVLFPRYFINSVIITAVIVILQLWLTTPAAYALAKLTFPGVKFLNTAVELGLFFGITGMGGLFTSQYIILNKMHLINTYPALILPAVSAPLAVFLLRQFIKQIPDDLIHAARIDGVSHRKICRDIIIPNSRPARITVVILAISGSWQAGVYNFVYSEEMKTISTVINKIGHENTGVAFALSVVLTALPLGFYMLYHKNIAETLAFGELK